MITERILTCIKIMAVCSFLLAPGCAQQAEQPARPQAALERGVPEAAPAQEVTVALKFTPQQSTTYRLITEGIRTLGFEGSFSDKPELKGGSNRSRVEMVFDQQVQSIDEKGNAVAKITIKDLKCLYVQKDKSILDFDSSRERDKDSQLAKLIGRDYSIKITPVGRVTEVLDAEHARESLAETGIAGKAALRLLSEDAIRQRHSVSALPAANKSRLSIGQTWSTNQTFSFDIMGSKSYEKIYTLKQIKDQANRQIAIAEMKAIPSSEGPQQPEDQPVRSFLDMFDNIETYTGQLELDLTTGRIEKYYEQLKSDWVAIEPSAEQQPDKEPGVLKMGAVRMYKLERVD